MASRRLVLALCLACLTLASPARAQHSVAREWNEVLLESIRNDFARPTVHARNLFHLSAAMYDAWAVYDAQARTYFLDNVHRGFAIPFYGMPSTADAQAARDEAISYAAYRILLHRFAQAPEETRDETLQRIEDKLVELGYDPAVTSTDYASGSPAALGNYIADRVIAFGMQDGANEGDGYLSRHYEPVNPELDPVFNGNPDMADPNRWQPLKLREFVGQAGFAGTPAFLSPEWGEVVPFSLRDDELTMQQRDGYDYWVYHDPGAPPYLDTQTVGGVSEEYKWGFALVAAWSGHLDPSDGVMWDISPGSIGNVPELPTSIEEYHEFYDLMEGGDTSLGHATNPKTGLPYEPNMVPRGDYARVLAEFWADGPDSETPPGHWFTILNYVLDHPEFERRFRGEGPVLDPLEYDVKAYFALAGAMHDCAVTAWGIKGWYDYVRPVSAIRYMCDLGQSTDPQAPYYHPGGIALVPGAIEQVQPDDPVSLRGPFSENVGKIKLLAWYGPRFVFDPENDTAGVGWILAEDWWPYQRPTFVTPPFAGYVSGHSTFSRAAAELLTLLTGDAYFPGGLGEFHAPQNEFLVFEDGPSVDVTLQWATYRDASDQTSLSRIWGGIHPPADDIPGRWIGMEIGVEAFLHAEDFFEGTVEWSVPSTQALLAFPNPGRTGEALNVQLRQPSTGPVRMQLYDLRGRLVRSETRHPGADQRILGWNVGDAASGVYLLRLDGPGGVQTQKISIVR